LILKLVIIGVILVAGGMLLYPEIAKLTSNYPQIEAVAEDIDDLKDTTVKRVNYEFDKTFDTVGDKIDKITPNPEQLNPIDDIQEKIAGTKTQEIYTGQVYETSEDANAETVSVDPIPQTQIFETLQLTTMRNDDNTVSIHYEDTSGKTLKVTVTLKNSEKQLFSGEFFASKFDTSVDDVSTSPHIIEMVVEHTDYGTVSSSVFNPQGNDETTIYGVFTK
jgi:hypothetical protein